MQGIPTLPGSAKPAEPAFDRLVWLMAVTAGAVVANNYYNQPLLAEFAEDFGQSERVAGLIATLTQIGYALGMLFLLPLGDMLERRRVISILLAVSSGMLLLFALAPTFPALVMVGFLVGFSSVVPQFLPPVAARLAPRGRAGQAVGKVMGGLLLGIILSRFVGGLLGGTFGWRVVYLVAAVLMLVLLVLLRRALPEMHPTFVGNYRQLLGSLARLFVRLPRLRILSFVAALQFGAFVMFWTTIVFHFESTGHSDATVSVGLLALIGAIGVFAAPIAGRISDRVSAGAIILASGAIMVVAFLVMGGGGGGLLWIIPGVVLLDFGMQVSHVTSMSEVLKQDPGAGNRLNTIYMVTRFGGGAVGTFAGSQMWHYFGWPGITALGLVFTVVALGMTWALQIAPAVATEHD